MPARTQASSMLGRRFGRVVVREAREYDPQRRDLYLCACDCGTATVLQGKYLRRGMIRSCGCLTRKGNNLRHGATVVGAEYRTTYTSWAGMKGRCLNPRNHKWPLYGGRGIRICDQWRDSFEAFLRDVGPKPSAGYSIDRIDVDGHYEPGNVRWATGSMQSRNKRVTLRLEMGGETLALSDWADRYHVTADLIRLRLRRGWAVAMAITTPVLSNDHGSRPHAESLKYRHPTNEVP
jgi:hypothetical protein